MSQLKTLKQLELQQTILEIEKKIGGKIIKQVKFLKPISPKAPPPPPSLAGLKAKTVNILQSLGNSIVVASLLFSCFLQLIIFRLGYPEIKLTCCWNAALIVANILVATVRQPVTLAGMNILTEDQCKASHLAIFYAYSVAYTFAIMLSDQIFYIRGAFLPKGWQYSPLFNIWFSVMMPVIPTVLMAVMFWTDDDYYGVRLVTEASCMGDLSSNVSRVYFIHLFFFQLAPTIINLESGWQYENSHAPLVGQDFFQRRVAQKASHALVVVLVMSMTSHTLTIVATYSQSLIMTTIVFGVNVATAVMALKVQLRLGAKMKKIPYTIRYVTVSTKKKKQLRDKKRQKNARKKNCSQKSKLNRFIY